MNKKRLAKKITTIGATTAIAFSVLAQPLSLIASATDAAPVTTAGEQQLAGAIVKSKNLVSNGKLTTIEQTNLTAKQIFPSWQAAAVGGGNNLDSLVLVGKDVNSRYVGTSTRDEYVYYKIDDSASDITSIGISGFGSTSYTTDYSGTGITEFTGRSTRSTRFALYQVIPTVVGQTYTLSKSVASNELNYSVYASNVGSISELASVKSTKYGSSTFVASSTSTKITVVLGKDADYVNEPALIWSRAASGVTVTKQINTTNLKAEIDALFINNNPDSGDIKDTTDEAAIDVLQKEIDCLEEGITKVEYQAELDLAKRYLNSEPKRQAAAEKAVKELFINNNVVNHIKETTNQAAIDAAQVKVNAVTDTTKKAELQVHVKKAQDELDEKNRQEAAQKAVNELFVNNNPANKIKDTTTQTMIDEAQKKVDSVVNPAKRAELQELVDKAQDALDEANNNVTAPTANTVTNKDTVVTGTGKPGLTAVVNIGTATYTATVGTNGKFSVTIPVQKADTIIRVSQKSTTKTSPVINVKVTNYIPNSAPIIDAIGPFQQAITGKVPAGTVSVRLVVNDHPQRLVTPDANGNFSFYSRFVTDGTVSNLRLQKGDKIVVDYGNKTPSNLATTTYVNDAVKPLIDVVKAESDYITGLVPTGTQVLRLSINGIAQRTVTPQADINAVTAGGIGTDGKFKIYTRFFRDSSGLTRKLHAGDTVTVDLGAQIPGDTGTTVTVIAK
ncbi:toxin Cry1Ac domain D-VI-related protein [Listeria ivanovii]|uniref:toxin Cry1Ac domain D-VI-related protein n=1 Tax=Listeria ivanovii TaxID=1638 RepID=UPI00065E7DEC|nr:toxin Cry1Ac domain D-VI-related protein [Listeria ivanovii]